MGDSFVAFPGMLPKVISVKIDSHPGCGSLKCFEGNWAGHLEGVLPLMQEASSQDSCLQLKPIKTA